MKTIAPSVLIAVLALLTITCATAAAVGMKPPPLAVAAWTDRDAGWAIVQAPSDWKRAESCGPGAKEPCDSCLLAHSDWKGEGGERFSVMVDLTCGIGGSAIWKVSRIGDRLHVDSAPPPGRCIYGEGGEEVDCRPSFYMLVGSVEVDDHRITVVYTGNQRNEAAYARCRMLIEGIQLRLHKLPKGE